MNHSRLDMSPVQLDGFHTPPPKEVGKQGIALAVSEPIDGNHDDLFEIEIFSTKMLADMEQAQISTNGLFLNTDAGFDVEALRKTCWSKDIIANIDFNRRNTKNTDSKPLLDDLLYKERCI